MITTLPVVMGCKWHCRSGEGGALGMYRSDTVNSKSFVDKDFLRIKWIFQLNSTL